MDRHDYIRIVMCGMLVIGSILHRPSSILAQCPNDNALTGTALSPPCPGSVNNSCVMGGQYVLVNVVAGNQYTFSTCTGTTFDSQITLYQGANPISLGYNDDACGLQSSVVWTATFTGQLRVLVDQFFCTGNAVCATLTVACSAPPPPLTNDNPCGAISLGVNSSCIMGTYTNAGATATAGVPAPGCSSYLGGDVWFTAVVPSSGLLNIETGAGVITDGGMAAYSAPSCSGPFTLIECDDDDGAGLMPLLNLTGLTPGATIYIRVWEYGNNNNGTFSICAYGPTIPAGDCFYVLNMYDSFGDGWDGSTVGVSINGGPFTTYTVTGTSNQVFIGLNIGDIFIVQYTGTSPFPGEISYNFQLGGGLIFSDGPNPSTGIVFSQTVDCNPPPAPPEDCAGGFTVCNNQAFSNNTSNTGVVEDLNAANQGCLASSERQGTWYHFSPSSPGNVAFTISPTDPLDDYDFAIWGPFSQVTCPPPGPPTRCSFAAPSGDTGLNYTAVDNTEGAAGDKWVNDLTVAAGEVYTLYISNWSQSGVSFNLNWNLTNGASLDCTVLPIELVLFEADLIGQEVVLNWMTATERNGDHFVVERSSNGTDFSAIGNVLAAGNSSESVSYGFKDVEPLTGIGFYRLKQVDIDGSFTYSPIRSVRSQGNLAQEGTVYPVPVDGMLNVELDVVRHTMMTIRIMDSRGAMITMAVRELGAGKHHIKLPTDHLAPGFYVVDVLDPDGQVMEPRAFIKR